jgi:uncharacterized protein YkwD
MKAARWVASGLLPAACCCAQAQTDDVVRVVNQLRAQGGRCAAAAQPVVARRALDAAASRLASGSALEAALQASQYRMTQARAITFKGDGWRPQLETLLVRQFCSQIASPQLSEIGVHEGSNQIWIVLAAPFAPKVNLSRQQLAQRMLELVNEARAVPRRCGATDFGAAGTVRWNAALESAADQHAADMAATDYFSHTGRDGSTPAQRVTRAGYRYRMAGENIAGGQLSPEEAVAGWIKSPGHCANLMNGEFTEMGVAVAADAKSQMGIYWVQVFGTPR